MVVAQQRGNIGLGIDEPVPQLTDADVNRTRYVARQRC
jgi:hypothetical protein